MKPTDHTRPGFWLTVRLLLGAARRRYAGRQRRQRQLLRRRTGRKSADLGMFGFAMAVLFMVILNVLAAFVLRAVIEAGQRSQAELHGGVVVSVNFIDAIRCAQTKCDESWDSSEENVSRYYQWESKHISEKYGGGTTLQIEKRLRDEVRAHGTDNLVAEEDIAPGITGIAQTGRLPAMLGSCVLLLWFLMLVFQGEGLELDLQRRRHPMWEWLFSHPVKPGAVFLAEMLSPIAANPIYWGAPLFVGCVYGFVYRPALGLLAAIVIGLPVTVAAACLGKALEIAVVLRSAPRSRGAIMGLMSWMGYASMMSFFLGLFVAEKVATALSWPLNVLTVIPWPWLRLFLGGHTDGSFSLVFGIVTTWAAASVLIAGAVWFSVWGAQQGLVGSVVADLRPSAVRRGPTEFGKEPLYRKEFLWFVRDRSAIVQSLLIPLTVAGFQLFNLRGLLSSAQAEWNYLCGAGILFGTYFLWILGPKSLLSEGSALWISLTWPRGLESLLKAKAWLWSVISSVLVALVLCYAAFLFPASIWKIALVGVGWLLFGRSMAEKTVTLVSVTSESGEQQPIPWGRRWAAQLGMLTFSIGVLTQQWHIAVAGIVYSYMTAAAMWQNFRARLPYLYDPWSERLPAPPTLMHAMIAISILVEGGSVLAGALFAATGKQNIVAAQTMAYGICAVIVSIGMSHFLGNRGVRAGQVWCWSAADEDSANAWWRGTRNQKSLLLGGAIGVLLAGCAIAYIALLRHFPATREIILRSQQQMATIPHLKLYYAVLAVAFAPFAEEYLFRGLLYKALDREWGGWPAILGSAAFFAIYHPVISWLPVTLLGITNAILFKRTGRLAPAVVLHMAYNAVITLR
jgi:membrane protease YdiL (CAAX protease family)